MSFTHNKNRTISSKDLRAPKQPHGEVQHKAQVQAESRGYNPLRGNNYPHKGAVHFDQKPRGGNGSSNGAGRPVRAPQGKRVIKSDITDVRMLIKKDVGVSEASNYESKHTFADFKLPQAVLTNVAGKGITAPSPIQDQSIPVVMAGGDVIGIASTGTGKTAAFLLPLIAKLEKAEHERVIVLAPTRELAIQIEDEWKIFAHGMRMSSAVIVGRASMNAQIQALNKKPRIVIGTPGRVMDLIKQGKLNMAQFGSIVLDEADRMLDMGFVRDMRYIMSLMPKNRQNLFFSATFGDDIKSLVHEFMRDPVTISIKTRDTASSVMQDVIMVNDESEKLEKLHDVLIRPEFKKVIIFREMKHQTKKLAAELEKRGFKVGALNGNMSNGARLRSVEGLQKGTIQAVIATDVAARGLDIDDVNLVINYDLPQTYDTYVHRIGRTGRGTKVGHALTFVVGDLHTNRALEESKLREAKEWKHSNGGGRGGRR